MKKLTKVKKILSRYPKGYIQKNFSIPAPNIQRILNAKLIPEERTLQNIINIHSNIVKKEKALLKSQRYYELKKFIKENQISHSWSKTNALPASHIAKKISSLSPNKIETYINYIEDIKTFPLSEIKDFLKIDEFYRDNYIKLRHAGVYPEYAIRQMLYPVEKVDLIIDRMYSIAKKLSKKHKVSIENILIGMSKNTYRTVDDWENYTKENKGSL